MLTQADEAGRAKRVLMLSTGSRFSIGFPILEQNAVATLRQLYTGELDFHSEYLDIVRFPSEKHHQMFRDYLRDKYAHDVPDLIIVFYAGNLRVAGEVLTELFPAVPVVAAGLTEEELPDGLLGDRATGIAQRSDADGTIKLILRLQPDVKQIVVIGGAAEFDRQVINRVMQAARSFTEKVGFEVWNDRPLPEILKGVASLPAQTAIFFTRMFRDGSGRAITSAAAAQSIARVANVPVYALTDATFGTGVLGGSVVDVAALGQRAGTLAHRVLTGAEPKSIPLEVITQGTPIFDWRALQRWGIPENRLPPNSVVRFKPQSLWEQYRWYIIGTLILIAIQTAIMVDLLLHRARRRRAETELRENHQFMELATKAGKMGLWMRDLEKGEIWANAHLRALFGFSQTDAIRFDDVLSRIHPYDRGRLALDVEQADKTELPFEGEFRAILPDGSERWVITRGEAVKEPPGRGIRRFGTVIDITERKQAEVALRESEERFRIMANSAPVMIWISGTDKLCTFFNKGWLDFTGRSMKEELGDGWVEGVHPEDFDRCLGIYTSSFEAQQEFTMEYRLRKYDGEYRYVLDTGVPRFEPDGRFLGYIGSAIDITERKRAEERFRLAVEASPNAIVMVNQHGEILLVNTLTEQLFGYSREELIGKSVEILVPERFRGDHPAHRAEFFAAPQARAMGAGRDLFARRKDGSEFQVEIGLNPIQTDEGTLVLTAIVDITERKRAESELRLNREELAHVARVSTMGELASSLAHEISQPLGAILRNAEAAEMFLQSSRPDLQEVAAILADIRKDDHRAGEVIDRMRALLKRREFQWSDLDLNALAEEVASLVRPDSEARKVKLALHLAPTVLPVRGDRVQLQQVLLNLLLNAMDAMNDKAPEERRVSVRTQLVDGKAEVAVSDVGHGITSENLERLFEPFFTTKPTGMGMGLAISQTIIGVHGGRIAAENNPDAGATFKLTLPMCDEGRRMGVER